MHLLERDLQLGKVEIAGVAEGVEELSVDDLRQHLVAGADAAVGRDVEDHRLGRDLLADVLDEHLDAWSPRPAPREEFAGALARGPADPRSPGPRSLAKLDFPEPKKPETQTPIPSCGLFGVSR